MIKLLKEREMTQFFSSGCTLLDCVLGGGWPLGRMSNIVGDSSTGKSLVVIEAISNFARDFENGRIFYLESEAAFDLDYASNLGLPVERVNFVNEDTGLKDYTVEGWYEHAESVLSKDNTTPTFYAVDSLDALSDRAEMEREIDAKTYAMTKQKKISELFRRHIKQLGKATHTMIVSQLRDKIGVTFGETKSVSGGRALEYYCSQRLWLAQLKQIKKTINKVERNVGVLIRARCKKNRMGPPHREAEFPISFNYGIDDLTASLSWLHSIGKLESIGHIVEIDKLSKSSAVNNVIKDVNKMEDEKYYDAWEAISEVVVKEWEEIEKCFLPTRKKYG